MTPAEYLKIEKAQLKIISAARKRIADARDKAEKCAPPKNRRPANSTDIFKGAIIWHRREKKHGGDYWNVVFESVNYGYNSGAYFADDGCCYLLRNAYVEDTHA